MIDLKQTDTEYLLFIPPAQKERARAIDGRRWDPDRKCWVYPRTVRMFDALIAEFGDDLLSISITRPTRSEQNGPPAGAVRSAANLQAENQSLKDDLAKIQESLEIIKNANGNAKTAEVQTLKVTLASRETELAEIRRKLELQEKELHHTKQQLREIENKADQLQSQNNILQREVTNRQTNIEEIKAQLRRMIVQYAIDASGKNTKFTQIIEKTEMNYSFCVAIGRELERELRQRLKVDEKTTSLYDLIAQANDAGILTPDGVDLAHFIRKQRNKMAHDGADPQTYLARMVLSLYAAALLWPELLE
jgi:myosin heavy subunit